MQIERQAQKEKLKAYALKQLSEKGLPAGLADYFHVETEEAVNEIITYLEQEWKVNIENVVNEKLKGKTPPQSQQIGGGEELTKEKIAKMSVKERMKLFNENPDLWNRIMNS
jgi:hypothetical protein